MRISNKRAGFEYKLEPEKYEAGLVLLGAEAKAVRENRADLSGAVIRMVGDEAWLINAVIPAENLKNYDSQRTRKLLLHKKELISLGTKAKQFKLTFVPISLYTKGRLVKLAFKLGKAKRKFEKRQELKKRDIEKAISQQLKGGD